MPILTVQRKKQKNLLIVLALVVVASFGVLYFGLSSQKSQDTSFIGGGVNILSETREIKLNLKLLGDDRFRSLIPYEKIPGYVDTGRDNPFIPYIQSNTADATDTNL